jgi:hypothetical protein
MGAYCRGTMCWIQKCYARFNMMNMTSERHVIGRVKLTCPYEDEESVNYVVVQSFEDSKYWLNLKL